ncbi:MAG: RelA/SpoT family protein [Sulfurimonas sp.]
MIDINDIADVQSIKDVDEAIEYFYSNIPKTPLLEDALGYTKLAHLGQFRRSGEPYVIHPILVASLVAKITNDEAMSIAALLHDVVEDTEISTEEVSSRFGEDVAVLVDGLTKIDSIRDSHLIPSSSNEKLVVSALSFRKMLLASIKDVRVLVVKLCDRLHNMLTLDALKEQKQLRIAEETLVVYAPIAHRLGISFIKNILEDISFAYLFKEQNKKIDEYFKINFHAIEMRLAEFEDAVLKVLVQNGFCEDDFEIISRVKHKYSIYLKMQRKGVGIDEVLDLLAIRIIVKNSIDCYKVLGLIHLNFQPLSSRFKDYIAVPKDNGYETIHTSVFYNKAIFEVQIRTYEMHKTAELGVAAHWKYKNGGNNAIKFDWLNNLSYQNDSVEEFYDLIKNDLYSDDIVVFSPQGEPFTLPRGAVVLDYAYAVHSEVGNRAKGALINRVKTSLISELYNGNIVKIELDKEPITRCSWLDAVKTSKAKTNMKLLCNSRIKDIDAKSSINIVATAMRLGVSRVEEWLESIGCEKRHMIPNDIELYREILHRYVTQIAQNSRFKGFLSRHKFKLKSYTMLDLEIFSTQNISDVVYDYCCHPKMGDEIVAFLEKSKAHIHHKMCQHAIKKIESKEPMLFVRWDKVMVYRYNMIVSLQSGIGSLAHFLDHLAKLKLDINSVELGKHKSETTNYCEIGFESKEADINTLRAKIERKIKIVHLTRKDDAYKN